MNEIEKKLKIRSTVGWILSIIIISYVLYNDLNGSIIFMITIPIMGIITWLNYNDDSSTYDNNNRFTLIALSLIIISGASYNGHLNKDIRIDNTIDYCYKQEYSNNIKYGICDEINSMLKPSSD